MKNLERERDYIIAGRIDIQCEILPVPFEKPSGMADGKPSATIRERVVRSCVGHYPRLNTLRQICSAYD